jgi:uncharacterized protein HemY
MGRNKEAADAFRKAIEQNGGRDPLANLKLGTALAIEKDYASAEQALRAAIEQRSGDFPEAQKQLALMFEKSDKPADAVREYRVYLEKHPDAFDRQMIEQKIKSLERRAGRQSNQ